MVKQELISVSNKKNIVEFAKALEEQGIEIISTGGTLKKLTDNGVSAKPVEAITGFPEILDGRVKTLHPNVHSGLLAKRDNPAHMKALEEKDITPIDMVVVNLYPFKETILKEDATEEDVIEHIDTGGPTMVGAAGRNGKDVSVAVDPDDYDGIIEAVKDGSVDVEMRKKLSAKVFRHTAQYDAMSARYFNQATEESFPNEETFTFEKVQDVRYGENPHQQSAYYKDGHDQSLSLGNGEQHNWKSKERIKLTNCN